MIVMITGGLGSGKTCLNTKYAVGSSKMGKELISNYHFNNMKYRKLDIVDLYLNHPELKNIAVFGDELYTFMDCRMSITRRNRLESYFIAQTRKANVDLYFTTQYDSFVDLRLVKFVDIWVEMSNIWLLNKKTNLKYKHPYLFIAQFNDFRNPKDFKIKTMRFDGRRFFKEYNTNERIYPPDDYIITEKEIIATEREKKRKEKKADL